MVSLVWLSATTSLPFCRARARRRPSTSSWRSGSNRVDLIFRYSPSSKNSRARLCCTGWLAKAAFHSTDSRPYQAAPASSSRGSRQRSPVAPPRWSTPIMV
ncbi:hypothetical protein D3C76_993430 [compost metagenome]